MDGSVLRVFNLLLGSILLLVFRVLMSKEAEECWLARIVRTIEKVATFQRSFLHCATERVFAN